jgi:type I restriction-modification system DNA methylase subunit
VSTSTGGLRATVRPRRLAGRRDWGDAQFDVVVGNPPFLNQLSRATSRRPQRFGGGPYADAAAEFLALAMRLARPGGRVGLVLPQSLLSTRDAAAIRAAVDDARRCGGCGGRTR